MTSRTFVIPGDPRPKGRPRFGNGFTYTPRETQRAEHTVKIIARGAKVRPLVGPVAIELRFYRATKRRCDVDNLSKLVLDALNGIAWKDDDQIADLRATKTHDADNPRTEVTVRPYEPRNAPRDWDCAPCIHCLNGECEKDLIVPEAGCSEFTPREDSPLDTPASLTGGDR